LIGKDQKLGATTFAYEKYGYDAMSRLLNNRAGRGNGLVSVFF
jgi:hypothetical protein